MNLLERLKEQRPDYHTIDSFEPWGGVAVRLKRLTTKQKLNLHRFASSLEKEDDGETLPDDQAVLFSAELLAQSIVEVDSDVRPFDSPAGVDYLLGEDPRDLSALVDAAMQLSRFGRTVDADDLEAAKKN